ncbi:MAG: 16S rRNA (uracil(1498)-N(3))-methyltransferase [Candidatus Synoicihabitans palmerolidicus]|nr:16S rRNA (uracil(1498)-N(3))-methyltransferase [Candidatus Synoicihabitans palmerolidicus]
MNIVLFDPTEIGLPLARSDERCKHVLKVLRRAVGTTFDVGLINGPRGKATVEAINSEVLSLSFSWAPPHTVAPTTQIVIGLPRPQTARDVLRDATTLGATGLDFIATARSDPNYAQSSLWTKHQWRRHVIQGAAQAFDTHVPSVTWDQSLSTVLNQHRDSGHLFIALDVYGPTAQLSQLKLSHCEQPVTLLVGPERGWDEADRVELAAHHIVRYSLGPRVLRTENVVLVALTLINAARDHA